MRERERERKKRTYQKFRKTNQWMHTFCLNMLMEQHKIYNSNSSFIVRSFKFFFFLIFGSSLAFSTLLFFYFASALCEWHFRRRSIPLNNAKVDDTHKNSANDMRCIYKIHICRLRSTTSTT